MRVNGGVIVSPIGSACGNSSSSSREAAASIVLLAANQKERAPAARHPCSSLSIGAFIRFGGAPEMAIIIEACAKRGGLRLMAGTPVSLSSSIYISLQAGEKRRRPL